jgi:hypothetical protein
MSIVYSMEVQFRRFYRDNNWSEPSVIRIGRGQFVDYINELNKDRHLARTIPHDVDPSQVYFKGVRFAVVDGLEGVELVA